jgi:selenocysteine lyase/cysteine desulfurase
VGSSCFLLIFCNPFQSMQAIHDHVSALQAWTYSQLSALRHSNGQPLLDIFGRHDTPSRQSCLFQFLVHAPNGSVVPAEEVEVVAAAAGVHLRTGCHCNPGQCLLDLGIEPQEVRCYSVIWRLEKSRVELHVGETQLEASAACRTFDMGAKCFLNGKQYATSPPTLRP